jgi:DNA-binding NarL/FixJ family response regulator
VRIETIIAHEGSPLQLDALGVETEDGRAPTCHDLPVGTSVLIVDDHAAFRATARRVLELAGCRIVGEAVDGESALVDVERLRPDAVLLDVSLPGIDGFAVAAAIARRPSPPRVILTSMRDVTELAARLAEASAVAFVDKRDLAPAFMNALPR